LSHLSDKRDSDGDKNDGLSALRLLTPSNTGDFIFTVNEILFAF